MGGGRGWRLGKVKFSYTKNPKSEFFFYKESKSNKNNSGGWGGGEGGGREGGGRVSHFFSFCQKNPSLKKIVSFWSG